ncbi:MAG: HAMP domain-containing histidine kinase [Muribaculaceae bacterium]|nr:HAMP domain-containing histidine kinase [Muribaculaceae bacterium]
MKSGWIKKAFLFIGLFGLIALAGIFYMPGYEAETDEENALVLLNEIKQLTADTEGSYAAKEQIAALEEQLQKRTATAQTAQMRKTALIFLGITLLCLLAGCIFFYFKILRPFSKLEDYAEQIAKGDFTVPLEYERENLFGAFTWAFDHMRKEIVATREREAAAIKENKTIIATLSHDIKTPIASIRAYAEGLEAGLDTDYATRERYLQVIMRKCDEVSRLVNDLALHSLSELEQLEINLQKCDMKNLLTEILQDLEYPLLVCHQPFPEAELLADEKRLAQAVTNLLENARKYAPESTVEVWAILTKETYEIHIRDYGGGIRPEDMPFVTQKFYRGQNVQNQPGSGLGLYIVNYIMDRMQGGLRLINHETGLEAVLWLPLCNVLSVE